MELILDLEKRYTYADYLTWQDGKRRELMDGFVKPIYPVPQWQHDRVSYKLYDRLVDMVEKDKREYQVFRAPIDVRLSQDGETADDKIYNVVQPDIFMISDLSKIDKRGCLGAPDFVAEVQSFLTSKYDMNEKLNLYEAAGVREYWVVFPYEKDIFQFILQPDGKYDKGTKYRYVNAPVYIFDGAEVDDDIFNC
jgi:Uma2 family endonuclease